MADPKQHARSSFVFKRCCTEKVSMRCEIDGCSEILHGRDSRGRA
jgi:hypothetical protein